MGKIHYYQLQEKYPGKVVALDQNEQKVMAVGTTGEDILRALKQKKLRLQNVVLIGPIQKKGAINVYFTKTQ